jgi:hypothetical protein
LAIKKPFQISEKREMVTMNGIVLTNIMSAARGDVLVTCHQIRREADCNGRHCLTRMSDRLAFE